MQDTRDRNKICGASPYTSLQPIRKCAFFPSNLAVSSHVFPRAVSGLWATFDTPETLTVSRCLHLTLRPRNMSTLSLLNVESRCFHLQLILGWYLSTHTCLNYMGIISFSSWPGFLSVLIHLSSQWTCYCSPKCCHMKSIFFALLYEIQ